MRDFLSNTRAGRISGSNATHSQNQGNFRLAPNRRHFAASHYVTLRAMCGRLRVGKENLHVAGLVGAAMCSASLSAVHMTAGHNALRGSGPGQQLAFENAMAHVGCPDRRIDRHCIMCCSPSQPSHHATAGLIWSTRFSSVQTVVVSNHSQ